MADLQIIPARHGVATFVPAGQVIKIINSSGTQVVDTWAFALPAPEPKGQQSDSKDEPAEAPKETKKPPPTPAKKTKKGAELPSQEDAEKATREGLEKGEEGAAQQKSGWGSYVPSLGWSSGKKEGDSEGTKAAQQAEQKQNSKTWGSYFSAGQGFSNYVPKSATETVSSFAAMHSRDPNKSYLEQLQDFSKTPVGASGWSALTGSGYSSSMYAGYQAWSSQAASSQPMEFMSMPHSRAASLHLRPQVDDTLVSNLREPMLTLVEDTSGGIHDTLVAACDPKRYMQLGADKAEEHGSCAENLVMALKELNERAGLKGPKAVGAEVTLNSVPPPLNLFMNVPWDDDGALGVQAPTSKPDSFVRFKAVRDVVVVMSACPNDIQEVNAKKLSDAHFLVEDSEEPREALQRTQPKKRVPPKKISPKTPASGDKPAAKQPAAPAPKKAAPASSTSGAPKALPARKKPAPPPVAPSKKPAAAAPKKAAEPTSNGTPVAPAAKKKPRKLTPKAKPAAE